MRKIENVGYTQFRDDEFIVDVYEYESKYEVWLRKDLLNSALYMFGFHKDALPPAQLYRMIDNELKFFEEIYDDWYCK